jgi:rod shape determining protein RodA
MSTIIQAGRHATSDRGDAIRSALVRVDWILIAAVLGVLAASLFVIDAATAQDLPGQPEFFVTRQALYVAVGLIVMVGVAMVDPDRLASWPWAIWGVLLGSLVVVFVLAPSIRGTRRWIEFGPINLQPSEAGKILIILVLAAIVADRMDAIGPALTALFALGVTVVPAAIVFAQPDLGTSIVYFVILAVILLIAGLPWEYFAVAGGLIVLAAAALLWVLPAAGVPVLKDYQVERLSAFIDSDENVNTVGYQLAQSKTAIGSGGALGKGPDGATQTINRFLPDHHTDFIFAVVAEMFGFVGGALLILVYGLIIWRGLRIVSAAGSRFDQLVAAGIVGMIAFQVFVNIGMTVGIMPVTGIPLPFMSYGGAHIVAMLGAVGLLLRINLRRDSALA